MIKRVFDIFASLFGLIILSPLMLYIAVLIKIRMPGPILFKQVRIGKNGVPFKIIKFRSMVVDHHGGVISLSGENRITPLGAKIRKFKLDELPELWNVFIGEMSLVGPRPDLPEYISRLKGEEKRILELRPGITCPASIKYSNEEELLATIQDYQKHYDEVIWCDKVRLNLEYYYCRNIFFDISLIFKTVFRIRVR